MRAFGIHNRDLEDTEVAAAYNGNSTPWKYADATPTSLADASAANPDNEANSTGNFASRVSATVTSSGDSFAELGGSYSLKVTTTAYNSGVWGNKTGTSGATGAAYSAVPDGTLTIGRRYVLSYTLKNYNISQSIAQELFTGTTSVESKSFTGGAGVHTHRVEFTATGTSLYFALVAGGAGVFYLDNWRLAEAGEVAAYTPKSINSSVLGGAYKWFDETSNANHGTITGATAVNEVDFLGDQLIRSDQTTRLTIEGDSTGYVNAGLVLSSKNGTNTRGSGVFMYDHGGDNEWFAGRPYATSDGYIISRQAPLTAPSTGNTAEVAKAYLHVETGGTVKATSGTSANLKQVSRVATFLLQQHATAANTWFQFAHNLGTEYVQIKVYEVTTKEEVEVAVKTGNWAGSATQTASGTGVWGTVTIGTNVTTGTNNINYAGIQFATRPAANKQYRISVIG
jgi:hypothetical protein